MKKPHKWKKNHSVSIIVLAILFGRNLSSSDFSLSLSYLSRKKGTSEKFLGLSLFISRLQKTFPRFPFFYFSNLEKLKSDKHKFFLTVASTIIETKYYCIDFVLSFSLIFTDIVCCNLPPPLLFKVLIFSFVPLLNGKMHFCLEFLGHQEE